MNANCNKNEFITRVLFDGYFIFILKKRFILLLKIKSRILTHGYTIYTIYRAITEVINKINICYKSEIVFNKDHIVKPPTYRI